MNMPYMSCHIDPENKWLIAESGFDEFPYVCPRFLKASFEQGYGRSQAMTALPDTKMLQEMSKTTIKSAQKQVDPPLLVLGRRLCPAGQGDARRSQLLSQRHTRPHRTSDDRREHTARP